MDHHPTKSPSSLPKLQRCLHWESGDPGEAAERGTLGHEYFGALILGEEDKISETGSVLTDAEREMAEWAAEWVLGEKGDDFVSVERRLSLTDTESFDELTFGHADAIVYRPDIPLLIDYKTGQEYDYVAQMDAYARMLMDELGCDCVEVAILYGRTKSTNIRYCTYSDTDYLLYLFSAIDDGTFPRCANEYCCWCKHHEDCEAVTREVVTVAAEYENDYSLGEYHPSQISDPAQMSKALDLAKIVEKWASSVKHHANAMGRDGTAIPGYKYVDGRLSRSVSDINEAFGRMEMEPEEFLSACTLSVSKLEKAMATKLEKKSVSKKIKEEVAMRLGALLTESRGDGYFKKERK
jgi:hypothetical protein